MKPWKRMTALLMAMIMIVLLVPERFIGQAEAATQEQLNDAIDQMVVAAIQFTGAMYEGGKVGDAKFDCFGLLNRVLYEGGFRTIDGHQLYYKTSAGNWVSDMYAAQWKTFFAKYKDGDIVNIYNETLKTNIRFKIQKKSVDLLSNTVSYPAGTILLKAEDADGNGIGHGAFCIGTFNASGDGKATSAYVKQQLINRYSDIYPGGKTALTNKLNGYCKSNPNDAYGGKNSTASDGKSGTPIVWDWRQRGANPANDGWTGAKYESSYGGYFLPGTYNHTNTSSKNYCRVWQVDALNTDLGVSINNSAYSKYPTNTITFALIPELGNASVQITKKDAELGTNVSDCTFLLEEWSTSQDKWVTSKQAKIAWESSKGVYKSVAIDVAAGQSTYTTKYIAYTDDNQGRMRVTETSGGAQHSNIDPKTGKPYQAEYLIPAVGTVDYPTWLISWALTQLTGSLKITKRLDEAPAKTETFWFKVVGEPKDASGNPLKDSTGKTITTTDYYSITLNAGVKENSLTINNLRPGTYTVTEVLDNKGTPISSSNFEYTPGGDNGKAVQVVINQAAGRVITNTPNFKPGSIVITKQVDKVATVDKTFYFRVTGGITGHTVDKIVSLTITKGQKTKSVTVSDLVVPFSGNASFTVTEVKSATDKTPVSTTDAFPYKTTGGGNVTVTATNPGTTTIYNNLEIGTITLNKSIDKAASVDKTFYFRLVGGPSGYEVDQVLSLTIAKGEKVKTMTIPGLVRGTYTITEIVSATDKTPVNDGNFPYAVSGDNGKGVYVNAANPGTASIYNKLKVGNLDIKKLSDPHKKPIEGAVFGIYSDEKCTVLLDKLVTDKDGYDKSIDIEIGNGKSRTVYVKELEVNEDLILDPVVRKEVIYPDQTTHINEGEVLNTERGKLTIQKDVVAPSDRTFWFRVTGPESYNRIISITTENGTGFVTLERLVPGTYTVTEVANENGDELTDTFPYEVTGEGNVTVNKGTEADTTITNTLEKDVEVLKVDSVTKKAVLGAEFHVYMWDGEDYTIDLGAMNEDDNAHHHMIGLKYSETNLGKFLILETKNPEHYTGTFRKEFTLDEETVFEFTAENTFTMFSKVDLDGELIPNCIMQILDGETVVSEWVTDENPHYIDDIMLEAGKTYILHEKEPAPGYAYAPDIEFTVGADGSVAPQEMVDVYTKVYISKTNIVTGKELPGATLVILDSNGEEVMKWVTDGTKTLIENKLVAGATYTLREIAAPDGFVIANEVEFTVALDGTLQQVEMVDDSTKVYISKIDMVTGEELPGATLVIIDDQGEEVMRWVTNGEKTLIESKLVAGKTYTLQELFAPDGFVVANEEEFTVGEDGKPQQVEMVDDSTKVYISKTDMVTGEEIVGAELVITDSEGEEVMRWITTGEKTLVESKLIAGMTYTLTEITAPDGYIVAESVEFTVSEDGSIDTVVMEDACTRVYISKADLVTGEELAGATLRLEDKDGNLVKEWVTDGTETYFHAELLPGETYYLTETAAPDGYILSEERVEIRVNTDGSIQKAVMHNKKTEVRIHKIDPENKDLSGAVLQIIDSTGKVVKEFTTEGKPIDITGLKYGKYRIHEVKAPAGYKLAADVPFEVDEHTDGTVHSMIDEKEPDQPKTGDSGNLWVLVLIGILSLMEMVTVVVLKRRNIRK